MNLLLNATMVGAYLLSVGVLGALALPVPVDWRYEPPPIVSYSLADLYTQLPPGVQPVAGDQHPHVFIVTLSDDDVITIRQALREAARLVRDPDDPLDQIATVTIADRNRQKDVARRLREALALFGETVE